MPTRSERARPSSREGLATRARRPAHEAALFALFTALTALALSGCQRSVNMATAQSPTWNATTIPYAGVREENRQYPDYGVINASILSAAAPAASGGRGARR